MITHGPAQHGDSFFQGYFGTPRTELVSLLGDIQPRRALELGCGAGANLALIKAHSPHCKTDGVEWHPEAAAAARASGAVDNLLVADISELEASAFAPQSYDVIVLSHILEHMAWPGELLSKCLRWRRDGGHLLIALPNVRHLFLLRELVLRGDFPYADAGILDRTHLRFYTRRSALRLLEEAGLKVLKCEPVIDGKKSLWLNRLTGGLGIEFTASAYSFLAA